MDLPTKVTCMAVINMRKKAYRIACRSAYNGSKNRTFTQLDKLLTLRDYRIFWSMINLLKHNSGTNTQNINTYGKKSLSSSPTTYTISQAQHDVKHKLDQLRGDGLSANDYPMTKQMLGSHMKSLRSGCAPGHDGLLAEHTKYAIVSDVIAYLLCTMFNIQSGVVPNSIHQGTLVPILRKPSLDPSLAKIYRSIVVSVVFSSILEMHILECSGQHQFHNTNIAVSLVYEL